MLYNIFKIFFEFNTIFKSIDKNTINNDVLIKKLQIHEIHKDKIFY